MVVRTMSEFMNDQLAERIKHLQAALNQAENIMNTLEEENKRLKDVLSGLTSYNNEGYILDSETLNEPVCSF
jgi:peptidoglycan hydrolase CwlO-like protein